MDVENIKRACSETLVLSLLAEKKMHGYDIGCEIDARTKGYFSLKHGTLYPVLHRLEADGKIEGEWVAGGADKPRKYYKLTKAGEAYREQNISAWQNFISKLSIFVKELAK